MSYISESPDRTLLTPREVASLFNVSPQAVYLWYTMGKIEGVKIGGRTLRIYASSVEEMILLALRQWIMQRVNLASKRGYGVTGR